MKITYSLLWYLKIEIEECKDYFFSVLITCPRSLIKTSL